MNKAKFALLFICLFPVSAYAVEAALITAMSGGAIVGIQASIVAFVVNYAVSSIVSRAFSKKPPSPVDNGVRQQVAPATVNSIPVVYGDAYLGGQFVDAVLSVDQKIMWDTLAISSISPNGQFTIDQTKIYYGDRLCTFDSTDPAKVISLTDGSGNVDTKIDGNLWIYQWKSDDNGNITSLTGNGSMPWDILSASNTNVPSSLAWPTTGRRMNGLAFAMAVIVYSRDDDTTQLQPITFRCSHYLNGAGCAKPGDVWYDYMTNVKYGAAMETALVDSASATALNAYSDQNIAYTNNQGNPATQPRYRINGVLDTGSVVLENVEKMLTACDSWMAYNAASGQWSIVINKAESTAFNFNDDSILGDIRISATDINQGINQVEAKFPSKLNKDIPDYVFLETPAGLLYDNEPINKLSTSFDLVNDSVQAQYLANRILEQARLDLNVGFKTTYQGIQINAGDVISVTNSAYGWTNKRFRVMKVNEVSLSDGNLGAAIEANEYNSQVYDDKDITEFDPNGDSEIPSPLYFSTLAAPTFVNVAAAAVIPEFTVRCTLPTTGRVVGVDLYYQTAVNSGSLIDAGWIYYQTHQLATGATYANSGYVDFVLTGIPPSPAGQQYFAAYVVRNDSGQSEISFPSLGLAWAPNVIVPSSLGTNYEWSPSAVPVPSNSTGTVVTTGQTVSVYLRVGPSIISVWDGTGTQPNNTWYITSASTTTGLTVTGPIIDIPGNKFIGTVTGLTVQEGYLTVNGSYKDSTGTVTNIGSSSVAIFQQRQGSNTPVLNVEWDPTNLLQKGPDGVWYPTPVSNIITTQADLYASVNGTQIGRYAYVLTYNVISGLWGYSAGINPGGNLNPGNFSIANIASADNGFSAQVTYNDGTNVIVNNITVSASESGISALVLYKDWQPSNIFTQASNAGAWSPTPVANVITTQCNLTAQRGGVDVGRTAVIAQYNISTLTWSFNTSGTHPGGNLNVANFSYVNTQNTSNGYVTTATYTDSVGTTTTAISISAIPSGANGTNGTNGDGARVAYLTQSQVSSAPPQPSPTSGGTSYPIGWSGSATQPSAGQVLYQTNGTYNPSTNTTTWSDSIMTMGLAVTVQSDNFVAGSAGWQIQRGTGNAEFNNVTIRGTITGGSDITITGDGVFAGANTSTQSVDIGGISYNVDYSIIANANTSVTSGIVRTGILGYANNALSAATWNAGVIGKAQQVNNGIGVVGEGGFYGGLFSTTNTGVNGSGLFCQNSSGATYTAFWIGQGTFKWGACNIAQIPNDSSTFLRGDGTWASIGSIGGGTVTSVSGTGSVSGITLSGTVTTSGSLSLGGSLSLTTSNLTSTGPGGSSYFLRSDGWQVLPTFGTVTSVSGTGNVYGLTLSGTVTTSGSLTLGGSFNTGSIPWTAVSLSGANIVASLSGTSGTTSGVTNVAFSGTLTGGASGTITWTMGTSTAAININVTSDARLKKDIQNISYGLEFVNKLRPVEFKWNHELFEHYGDKQAYGFLANEVEDIVGTDTTMVTTIEQGPLQGYKSFSNDGIVAALVKSVQEMSAKITELEAKISSMEK